MSQVATDLFSTFTLKNYKIKNRIGVAPMTRMSGGADSIPRQDVLEFLKCRARNDAAIVYTEAIVTDYESAQGYPGQARLTTQKQIDVWRGVADQIRKDGGISVMQMFHCGRMAWEGVNPANRVIAPSSVAPTQDNPLTGEPYPVPEEMSQFDIDHVIEGFVETARGAVAAGFDGIEIHGAHGYLISQFLSSYSNKRKDGYGGSVANRFRFASEVIKKVKAVVPDDKLLVFRLSNWGIADMDVSLFTDSNEWKTIVKLLSAEPIDALSISTYDFQQAAFETDKTMSELTRETTGLPLLICGKIYDRETANLALEFADVVLFGKSALLNPDLVQGLKEGATLSAYSSEEANIAYTDTPLP